MTRKRILAHVATWTLPSLFFLTIVHCVYTKYRIETPPRLDDDARAAIANRLRAAFTGATAALADAPGLQRELAHQGPVTVQIWLDGIVRGRVDGYGKTVAAAVESAAGLLPKHEKLVMMTMEERERARLKVDVIVGRGELEQRFPLLDLVTLHPGLDGIGVAVDGVEHVILPDELILAGALMKKKPFQMIPDFALGLDLDKVDTLFAKRAGLGGPWKDVKPKWHAKTRRYFRLRSDAFVERPTATRNAGPPLPLLRGIPDGPDVSKKALQDAAIEGGRYLVAHMQPTGRYVYEVDLNTGSAKGGYSIPRHAGTTYFLAELYRISKEPFLKEPIERAFKHLADLIDQGGCRGTLPDGEKFACVVDKGGKTADLGSSALAVVSLAEYQRATGEKTFEPMARELSAWILMMQRPDGSFRHRYDIPNAKPDDKTMLLYYSGEAALAMARMWVVTGEERYATSSEKALDWLVGWYDFFAGGFLYGEEHWTCIASEAIFPYAKNPKYLDFCNGYSRFLRNQQAEPGEFPSEQDLVGAYSVTPFVMPNNTPAGSRTEAMISTYLLGKHHGAAEPVILNQILMALKFTLRQQVRPESDYHVAAKANGLGGVPGSPIDRNVRIDYVQHVCSAMIRTSELID